MIAKSERVKKRYWEWVERSRFLEVCNSNSRVLCLGAGVGNEVVMFIEKGYWSIGIDLAPRFPHVIAGDFQNIPFRSGVFDVVYSNAVDHVFSLESFAAECSRVLKVGGIALFHLAVGCLGKYESLRVDKTREFIEHFKRFQLLEKIGFAPFSRSLNTSVLLRKIL